MGNRLRLEGDHSGYHAGSTAVFQALHRIAREKGWRIVGRRGDYDVMVMNGEGTMHHAQRACVRKIGIMREALDKGKPVHLVNTVWRDNPNDFDDVLRALSGIVVRETRSHDDLLHRHGVQSRVVPDVSMYAEVGRAPLFTKDFRGQPAVTDFYWPDKNEHARGDKLFPEARYLRFGNISWSRAVASLKTASYLITGRQHAVYAACKARIPFVASEAPTDKIKSLIESAGVKIPVADSPEQIRDLIPLIPGLKGEFEKLSDWLERQDYASIIPEVLRSA